MVLTSVRPGGAFSRYMESPPGPLPFTVGAWGAFFCVLIGPTELSLYSLCAVRARLGRCCVILIFSPSGSHFGETRGALFALYGIAPRASAIYGRSLLSGGRFCVIWLQPARRLEMRKLTQRSICYSTVRPTQSILHHEWRTTNHPRRTNNSMRF